MIHEPKFKIGDLVVLPPNDYCAHEVLIEIISYDYDRLKYNYRFITHYDKTYINQMHAWYWSGMDGVDAHGYLFKITKYHQIWAEING